MVIMKICCVFGAVLGMFASIVIAGISYCTFSDGHAIHGACYAAASVVCLISTWWHAYVIKIIREIEKEDEDED